MPIYEFRCCKCDSRFTVLVHSYSVPTYCICPACSCSETSLVISSFAYHRSEKAILEKSGEPKFSPQPEYYEDPRNVGRWTEKRFKQLGLEIPPEINRQIQIAREGELSIPENGNSGT